MASPKGAKRTRPRGLWQVSPFAKKLSRAHRNAARADHTFEQALREQTMYSERIDSLISGKTWFIGRRCEKCGQRYRRVYDCSCWTCQKARSTFTVDGRNRCVMLSKSKHSMAGHLARLDEKRRAAAGEYTDWVSGDWTAREFPGGRLHVTCKAAQINSTDFAQVPNERIFELCTQHHHLVTVLRMANWSI